MPGSSALQLRWIWVSVYIIAGALASMHLLFASVDSLPDGIFYAGFGGACFIGAALAALQSKGSSVVEASLAALFIGALNLVLILLFSGPEGLSKGVLSAVSAPLSTTFVCFAGALAGGRVGSAWYSRRETWVAPGSLALSAVLVLIGAAATHAALIAVVAEVSEGLAVFMGIFLFFTTPALAGAALQLTVRKSVLSDFAGGLVLANVALLVVSLVSATPHIALYKLIATAFAMGLLSVVTFVLVIPGVVTIMHSNMWLATRPTAVPLAVLKTDRS